MPRHRVINKRPLRPLSQRGIPLYDQTYEALQTRGRLLEVSLGSLTDTAVRDLLSLADDELLKRLYAANNINDEELAHVRQQLRQKEGS